MEEPNTSELADVLACLSQLYSHCDDEAFPRLALRVLRELVPCEMAAFELRLDTEGKHAIGISEPFEVHDDPLFAAFEEHMLEDPLVAIASETGRIPIVAISDLVSRRDYEETGVYRDYFRHYGVRDRLAFSISGGGPEIMGIALNRSRRGFCDRDRRVLRLLRPHLLQAWRNAQAMGRLQRRLCERSVAPPPPQPLEPWEICPEMRASWTRAAGLTRREADVLAKVAGGLTNKEVGRELNISARTVTKHLENVFPKLGVATRAAAAALYISCAPRQNAQHLK
jgi:DNA-binding CsgD family transcriptional regulator